MILGNSILYWYLLILIITFTTGIVMTLISHYGYHNQQLTTTYARITILSPIWPLALALLIIYWLLRGLAALLKAASGKQD